MQDVGSIADQLVRTDFVLFAVLRCCANTKNETVQILKTIKWSMDRTTGNVTVTSENPSSTDPDVISTQGKIPGTYIREWIGVTPIFLVYSLSFCVLSFSCKFLISNK